MITVNITGLPEFQRTLARYAEFNKRSFPEICNAKLLNIAFRAMEQTKVANAQEIKNLPLRSWWPKYIAKTIKAGGQTVTSRTKLGKVARFVTGVKSVATKRQLQGTYTRRDAQQISRQIIARRMRAVSFIIAGWLPTVRKLAGLVKDKAFGSTRKAKQIGRPKGECRPANISALWRAVARGTNNAMNPKKGSPYAPMAIAREGLERAIRIETADMNSYVERKLREAANKAGVPITSGGRIYIPHIK